MRRMRLPATLRTSVFRLTVGYLALFAGSAFAFLAYIYFATAGHLYRAADAAITSEIAAFAEAYGDGGVMAVNARIIAETAYGGRFVYDLTDPQGRRISGVVDTLPPSRQFDDNGRVKFTLMGVDEHGDPEGHAARGQRIILPGGYQLFVAMDLGEHAHFIVRILRAVWAGAILVSVLGVMGGLWFGRLVERRIAELNRVVNAARAGDLARRAPVRGVADEYDGLAQHLNAMLDRIEQQTAALKSAGNALAHDLRTPLTRLRTRLELALQHPADTHAEAIRRALAETDRLLVAFQAMLNLTRLESGREPADMTVITIDDVVADVAELYIPVFEERGVVFDLPPVRPVALRGSPSLLAQALSNLLDNALVHADGLTRIMLSAGDAPDGLVVAVADDGPGIAPDRRAEALQRFTRLDDSRSRPGIGLGLSLVGAVAELHGGRLVLGDGLPRPDGGVGLRVTLILPKLSG